MPNQFNVSLWGDEAFSAVLSSKSIPEIIKIISKDTSPPLYNISEHIWFQVFGNSEISIRALSFLYFVTAAIFVYKIGAFLWDKKTGILSSILAFSNPFFFIYAFEGRMYSMLAASVTASMYFFIKRNWIFYIISTTLALYSHHFSIFALIVQGMWFIKETISKRKKTAILMLKSFIIIGILYAPWIIPLFKQTKMVGSGFWLATPTLQDLKELVYKYLAQGISHPLSKIALYQVGAILVLRRWRKDIPKTFFLASWFAIPILLTWIISQKFQSIFFDRYLLYTIPAAMLILASQRSKISSFFILTLIVSFAIIDSYYFIHPTKLPFRDLANYVKENQRKEDSLINWNSKAHHLWESKYYNLDAPIYVKDIHNLPFYVGTALMQEDDLIDQLPNTDRIGVITSGSLEEISLDGYTQKQIQEFGPLKFIWYEKFKNH